MNATYTAKQTNNARTGEACNSLLRDGELVADCTLPSEAKRIAQMLNEHAALVVVVEALIAERSEMIHKNGNALAWRKANVASESALANLAATRQTLPPSQWVDENTLR